MRFDFEGFTNLDEIHYSEIPLASLYRANVIYMKVRKDCKFFLSEVEFVPKPPDIMSHDLANIHFWRSSLISPKSLSYYECD